MPDIAAIELDSVVARTTLDGSPESFSGARLERAALADGRRVVLKRLPSEGDWLTRATDGAGRVRVLWESGVLDGLRAGVDHTVLDLQHHDGHDVVVMRDATGELLPEGRMSSGTARAVVAGIAAMHEAGRAVVARGAGLCTVGARYSMFDPAVMANEAVPNPHPARTLIIDGWERFAERAPVDLTAAVRSIHADPSALARQLEAFEPTIVHGDVKPANLGLGDDGLVAIDWGELTGVGAAGIDVAWHAIHSTTLGRVEWSPADAFAAYDDAAVRPLDPLEIDLACLGAVAQMGFLLARFASDELFAWWALRACETLDRTGLV